MEFLVASPRQRVWWMLAVAGVLAGVAAWIGSPGGSSGDTTVLNQTGQGMGRWFATQPQVAVAEASAQAASNPGEAQPFNPLDTTELPTFRATPQGKLVVDVQTRNDIERMVALFAQDNGLQRLALQSADLPEQAQRELRDLYQRYLQYSQAVTQSIPQGQGTLDEAAQQLKILHDLRAQYFGAEQAEAMFGAEEATAAELMALMRQQTDPNASLEERAIQAQELLKKDPPKGP
jgi:Proteobacterial lipase chaperone protein